MKKIYENEQPIGSGSYSCVGTTEAAEPPLSSPVEPEEREDMDMEAVAHRLVLLIVHLQEQHIWVLLRKLANLRKEIDFSEHNNLVNGSRIRRRVRSTANSIPFLFTPLGEEHGNRRSQGRRSPR